jgi:hypothetical protein
MSDTQIDIFLNDLSKEKQDEIIEAIGDNGNYDSFPIATIFVGEVNDNG